MAPFILRYGIIAGLIVSLPWLVYMLTLPADGHMNHSMLLGYTLMLLAFSMVFVGIRQYRDRALGGTITFGRGVLLGLGISAVAGVIYVIGWEICMAFSKYDFIAAYSKFILDEARARGADAAAMERAAAQAADFARMYRNPIYRMAFTLIEIFPVGLLVTLISAGLLRNRKLLPARSPVT
ncbi:MAG TPA: DUF4199 domain-containing protein [Steroidobacteraceae bacterium]|nr:DUF4199 domain-containing protein [Steroidobacteraceae bacterium]